MTDKMPETERVSGLTRFLLGTRFFCILSVMVAAVSYYTVLYFYFFLQKGDDLIPRYRRVQRLLCRRRRRRRERYFYIYEIIFYTLGILLVHRKRIRLYIRTVLSKSTFRFSRFSPRFIFSFLFFF